MSGLLDESARVAATYAASLEPHPQPHPKKTVPARVHEDVVEITLSPEAQATLASINAERAKAADRAERAMQVAKEVAKEVAAIAGVSEADAVAAAQPLRSPPPAKGVVMFQANMDAAQATYAKPK